MNAFQSQTFGANKTGSQDSGVVIVLVLKMTSGSMQLVILILCLVVVSVQGQNSLQDSSRSSGSEPSVHDLERHIESDNTSDVFAQTVGVEFDDILNGKIDCPILA